MNRLNNENGNGQIQVFENTELGRIRAIEIDGEPWFVAKDVCDILGMTNSRKALARLDEEDKGVTNSYTLGGSQEFATINEPGLYSLILTSRKSGGRQLFIARAKEARRRRQIGPCRKTVCILAGSEGRRVA